MDDDASDDALHCAHNGWHPTLEAVLERLDLLTGRDRAELRQLLIDRAGAREVEDHLVGSLTEAVDVLHATELDALRALYALGASQQP